MIIAPSPINQKEKENTMNKELVELIITFAHLKDGEWLTEDTRLEEDLFIYGEDAKRLLLSYSNQFKVDISGFEFTNHFTNEMPDKTDHSSLTKDYDRKISITLEDLDRGIQLKRLDEEIISTSVHI